MDYEPLKLAVIVLAHRVPEQLGMLLERLRHPRVRIYLHLDRAVASAPFDRVLAGLGEGLTMLPRHRTRWGGIEVVEATIDGLRRGVAEGCDYFVLLSGQDLMVRPIDAVLEFFRDAQDRSYVQSFPLPTDRWRYEGRLRTDFYTFTVRGRRETCIPRCEGADFSPKGRVLNELLLMRTALLPARSFPRYARPVGGSQWWNLSRSAADHVLRFLDEHPDYHAYHRRTLLPDELYFQSMLLGTAFSESHEIRNDCLRFMVWPADSSHPKTLTMADLLAIQGSGLPFARKFDIGVDRAVAEALSVLDRL